MLSSCLHHIRLQAPSIFTRILSGKMETTYTGARRSSRLAQGQAVASVTSTRTAKVVEPSTRRRAAKVASSSKFVVDGPGGAFRGVPESPLTNQSGSEEPDHRDPEPLPPRKRGKVAASKHQTTVTVAIDVTKEATNAKTQTKAKGKSRTAATEPTNWTPSDFPARIDTPWKVGPHVSVAGGVENAVWNAASLGATAFALFTQSARKWSSPPITSSSAALFKERMREFGYDPKHVLPHGNYLINLGSPDEANREKAFACFLDELKRCEQLGLHLYNFHPGSTTGKSTPAQSCSYIAQGINRAHKLTTSVVTVIENMAGAGNVLGSKFSELAAMIEEVEDKSRVGVCLDTCHLFAAGYDIRTREGWEKIMTEFDKTVGLKYLRGMHLNDSKGELGSHKDRHENIGMGHLGLAAFAHILCDPRTHDVPLILETPAHDEGAPKTRKKGVKPGEGWDVWKKEVEVLQRVAQAESVKEEELVMWAEEIEAVVGDKKINEEKLKDAKGKDKGKVTAKVKAKEKKSGKRKRDESEDDEDDESDDE